MRKSNNREALTEEQVNDLIEQFKSDLSLTNPGRQDSSHETALQTAAQTPLPPPEPTADMPQKQIPQQSAVSGSLPSAPAPVRPVSPAHTASSPAVPASGLRSGVGIAVKLAVIAVFVAVGAWLLSSGRKMNLDSVTVSAKDRDALFSTASANLLSEALTEIHHLPKIYILERNDEPTPVPNPEGFNQVEDAERHNYDDSPTEHYKDETIEVWCWKENIDGRIYNFSEITIADASQFRRKLVDNVVSSDHEQYPSRIFRGTNGVVGMTSDFCAFRPYGTIVHNGELFRYSKNSRLELMLFDKNGNLSGVEDSDFKNNEAFLSGNIIYTFAFGPRLVDDYQVLYSDRLAGYYRTGELGENYPRAAICQYGYDKHYLLCTVDFPGTTAARFAEVLQAKGVRFAYNLDGGQTAALMFHNYVFNKVAYGGEREVSDILFFATALPNE